MSGKQFTVNIGKPEKHKGDKGEKVVVMEMGERRREEAMPPRRRKRGSKGSTKGESGENEGG